MTRSKPRKGNPRGLTYRQHVFPTRSIARFARPDGLVSVQLVGSSTQLEIAPGHSRFWTERTWDERAEKGYMKSIEDRFQRLADRILRSAGRVLPEDTRTVSEFFALWSLRAAVRDSTLSPQPAPGVAGERLTKDQEEILESRHCGYVGEDGTIPARQIVGMWIQMHTDRIAVDLRDTAWGVVRAGEGEFLVPDTFGGTAIVPVSPTLCLIAGHDDATIANSDVAVLNRLARSAAVAYCFAKEFRNCPE